MIYASLLLCSLTGAASIDPSVTELVNEANLKDFVLFTDGRTHYLATNVAHAGTDTAVLYGDGKIFYASHVVGYSGAGDGSYDLSVSDPRVKGSLYNVLLDATQAKIQCGPKVGAMQVVPQAEALALFNQASFKRSPREFGAYALSRDEEGSYYLVLRGRFPDIESKFRVFAGPKGNMKELKLVNVVSDSEGDIFSSTKGELRLILEHGQSWWIVKKMRTPLTVVPVENNQALIHNDLGVFLGQRYGTPCDDY